MQIIRPVTFALCLIVSIVGLAASGSRVPAQQSAGYRVANFLGSTFISQIEVSPTGRWVAFITNRDDFATDRTDIAVWVADVSTDGSEKSPLRLTTEPGEYSQLRWSSDEQTLAVWSKGGPGGAASIILFDSRNTWRSTTVASPTAPGGIVTYAWVPSTSSLAFVSAVPLDSSAGAATSPLSGEVEPFSKVPLHHWQLYRVDVKSGQLAVPRLFASLSQAPHEIAYSPDSQKLALLVANNVFVMPADGRAPPRPVIARLPWQHLDGDLRWTPRGIFARGYGEIYGGDHRRTQRRFFRILPESGTVLVEGSKFRGEWLAYAPVSDGSLIGVGLDGLSSNIYSIVNGAVSPAPISARTTGISAISSSANGNIVAYVASAAKHFPELYVARGVGKLDQAIRVTSLNQLLDEEPEPETEVVRWPNGDGDRIEGVLYWPPGKLGMKRLPTIVVLHGGPQQGVAVALAESSAPFANYPALLASRGYLVLYPAFRGTTGFGDKFMRAVDDARCSGPSKDVITGVDYLLSKGWADPTRLGIIGTSFGGTTTDCVIGRTTQFRAAVSSEGSFDGISASGEHASPALLMARAPSTRPTPYNDHEHFWNESAIGNATRIRTPTLIDRGSQDVIVNPAQSEELATALAANGVPYRLLLFPGEGHMFARPEDKLLKLEAEIAWMDHYLLGRPLP